MNVYISNYIKKVESVKKQIRKISTVQISSTKHKDILRSLISEYFEEIRPVLVPEMEETDETNILDNSFQNLLAYSHKKGIRSVYEKYLDDIRNCLIKIESTNPFTSIKKHEKTFSDKIDDRIVSTLMELIPSAANSYSQALLDLRETERLSWRGPGTDLRESLRETLDVLAPDEDVKKTPGYKQEPNTNGPTMKQKVRYILKNREVNSSIIDTADNTINYIEELMGSFVRSVYTRSSVSTHTVTTKVEILKLKQMIQIIFCDILELRLE